MRNEHKIQADILKYLKDNHIFHFRYNASTSSFGLPDIIAIFEGFFVGIEVKDPNGRSTLLQQNIKKSIEEAGAYHVFATSVADVEQLLEKVHNQEIV